MRNTVYYFIHINQEKLQSFFFLSNRRKRAKMISRAPKPKLSLSINSSPQPARPTLSLKTQTSMPRTPVSPSPISPTIRNTRLNASGYSTVQVPSYAYTNSSSAKSILKKGSGSSVSSKTKKLQIALEPVVYSVSPIEAGEEYYGAHVKMSRDERRWGRNRY